MPWQLSATQGGTNTVFTYVFVNTAVFKQGTPKKGSVYSRKNLIYCMTKVHCGVVLQYTSGLSSCRLVSPYIFTVCEETKQNCTNSTDGLSNLKPIHVYNLVLFRSLNA
jgi:hypothetical protein